MMKAATLLGSALAIVIGAPGLALAEDEGRQSAQRASEQGAQAGESESGASEQSSSLTEEQIMELQRSLAARDLYRGAIDGVWGDKTQSALRNFQVQHGFEATGELDRETASALGVEAGRNASAAREQAGQQRSKSAQTERSSQGGEARQRSQSEQSGMASGAEGPRGERGASARERQAAAPAQSNEQGGAARQGSPTSQSAAETQGGQQRGAQVSLESLSQAQARELQERLKAFGYYRGPVDGSIGQNTRSALQQYFQRQAELAQQGTIGEPMMRVFGPRGSEVQPVSGRDDAAGGQAPRAGQPAGSGSSNVDPGSSSESNPSAGSAASETGNQGDAQRENTPAQRSTGGGAESGDE